MFFSTTDPGVIITLSQTFISFEMKLWLPITTFFPIFTFPEIVTLVPILQKFPNLEL